MPRFSTTLFFGGSNAANGKYGWSETWYIDTGSRELLLIKSERLIQRRARLLGQGAFIEAFRVGDIDVPRDGITLPADVTDGAAPTGVPACDMPYSGVLAKFFGDAPQKRGWKFLRGVPDNYILTTAVNGWAPSTTWSERWDSFVDTLEVDGWGFLNKVTPPNAPPMNPKNIIPVVSAFIARAARRDTGRPFGLPVGRQP